MIHSNPDPVKLIEETLDAIAELADDRLSWLNQALLLRVRKGKPEGVKDGSIEDYLGTRAAGRGQNDAWRQCRFNLRDKAIREAAKLLIEENPLPDSTWLGLEVSAELHLRMNRTGSPESLVDLKLKEVLFYDPNAKKLKPPTIYGII